MAASVPGLVGNERCQPVAASANLVIEYTFQQPTTPQASVVREVHRDVGAVFAVGLELNLESPPGVIAAIGFDAFKLHHFIYNELDALHSQLLRTGERAYLRSELDGPDRPRAFCQQVSLMDQPKPCWVGLESGHIREHICNRGRNDNRFRRPQ